MVTGMTWIFLWYYAISRLTHFIPCMVKVTKETKIGEEGLLLWSRSKTKDGAVVHVTAPQRRKPKKDFIWFHIMFFWSEIYDTWRTANSKHVDFQPIFYYFYYLKSWNKTNSKKLSSVWLPCNKLSFNHVLEKVITNFTSRCTMYNEQVTACSLYMFKLFLNTISINIYKYRLSKKKCSSTVIFKIIYR